MFSPDIITPYDCMDDFKPRNTCAVRFEDMRYAKTVIVTDKFGKEKEVQKGPVIYKAESHNLVVDTGRKTILELLTGLSTTTFLFGGVGSSGASSTDPTQTALTSELTVGGPAARPGLLDLTGGSLTTGDVVSNISGSNRWLLTVVYSYTTAQFNGDTFAEYGLFSAATYGTGVMLCRFVPTSSFSKTSSFQAVVEWGLAA